MEAEEQTVVVVVHKEGIVVEVIVEMVAALVVASMLVAVAAAVAVEMYTVIALAEDCRHPHFPHFPRPTRPHAMPRVVLARLAAHPTFAHILEQALEAIYYPPAPCIDEIAPRRHCKSDNRPLANRRRLRRGRTAAVLSPPRWPYPPIRHCGLDGTRTRIP